AAFQRRNFAVACAAAEAYLQAVRGPGAVLDEEAVRAAAATATSVPGRFQLVDERPPTIFDGAHNPDGMQVLVESLGEYLAGGEPGASPIVGVVSILDDKDAAGMLAILLPRCAEVVFTASSNPRALPPATLESLARQLGGPPALIEPDPPRALAVARERAVALAREPAPGREPAPDAPELRGGARGREGVVVATGSIYLVGDLLRAVEEPAGAGAGEELTNGR
ncbi:MAG TPA: cyanophycin synthetase, partial [Solirubrobacteraceae bacterium]|nr:cyanophycin synthetase [Solirubrobacteraceae bacterium]